MAFAAAIVLSLAHCGGPIAPEATSRTQERIVTGADVDAGDSPVLFVNGPEGFCTAVLIAANLVATARHCVATLAEGAESCTPAGELAPGSVGGALGADNAPGSIYFYASSRATAGVGKGTPDAIGAQIFSTQSPSACRDDLAFVVLDRPFSAAQPIAVRLDTSTATGEMVKVYGYGLTDQPAAAIALRVRGDATIVGVGPSVATDLTQAAPVRSVRVGPGEVTCNGDSGGAIIALSTGALVAIVSAGAQASALAPYCAPSSVASTTGPRLAEYRDLALSAFAAADAGPLAENVADAALSADSTAGYEDSTSVDAGDPTDADVDAEGEPISGGDEMQRTTEALGGGCAIGRPNQRGIAHAIPFGLAVILSARGARAARRKTRRKGKAFVRPACADLAAA